MNIVFKLTWEPVQGARSYTVCQIDPADGLEDVLTETSETYFDAAIDDSKDYAFTVRASDGVYYSEPVTITYMHARTLGDIRDEIRVDLKDSDKSKWTDAELENYIRDAIKDYAKRFPKNQELSIACVEDQREYGLPDAVQEVYRVEYQARSGLSHFLKYSPWRAGEVDYRTAVGEAPTLRDKLSVGLIRGRGREYLGHWDFRAGKLILDFEPAEGDALKVRYAGTYIVPPFAAVRTDVPGEDLEMLKLFAKGSAFARVEGQDANLQRWDDTTSGTRADNPLTPVSTRYFNAYLQRCRDKQERGRIRQRVRS